jgi:hypothetical protein
MTSVMCAIAPADTEALGHCRLPQIPATECQCLSASVVTRYRLSSEALVGCGGASMWHLAMEGRLTEVL